MPLTCALLGTGNSKANNTSDDDGVDDAYDDSDSDGADDSGAGGDGDSSPAPREHSVTGLVLDVLPVPSTLSLALWHFQPDNFMLSGTVLCIIGCSAASWPLPTGL